MNWGIAHVAECFVTGQKTVAESCRQTGAFAEINTQSQTGFCSNLKPFNGRRAQRVFLIFLD